MFLDPMSCIAYIDGANLHKGIQSLGWRLDYKKFRVWLTDKYSISKAYLFIGMISKHADLYTELNDAGYTLVFKEVIFDRDGKAKGNCDADLVLRATRDVFEEKIDQTVLVSSDGDYASLIRFWNEKRLMTTILSPAKMKKCSILLKRTGVSIVSLDDQRSKIRGIPK